MLGIQIQPFLSPLHSSISKFPLNLVLILYTQYLLIFHNRRHVNDQYGLDIVPNGANKVASSTLGLSLSLSLDL